MNNDRLFVLLEKGLNYIPIVYKQTLYTTNQAQFDNKFILEYKHTDLPDDSLLFFVPSLSSNDSNDCKLMIRIPYVNDVGEYRYRDVTFDIIVEENDLTMRKAKKGDIIAYRMCIFRFQKSSNRAILCNSPLYDDAIFSNLKVRDCRFINRPTFVDPTNPENVYTLVTTKEFNELLERVEKLENKFIYGTEDPDDALADSPTGTIYIQIEDE